MKKVYFGTNTKMYKTPKEAIEHVSLLAELTKDIDREKMELFVIPSFVSLEKTLNASKGLIRIGAQNMGWLDRGQLTGEISPLMLSELGISYVMIGHSERRHILHETDEDERLRVNACMSHHFIALLCVGEDLDEKNKGLTKEVIKRQLSIALKDVKKEDAKELIRIAYEPVWSIGDKGIAASKEYAQEVHAYIKEILHELFKDDADYIPVLYGGSVNIDNCVGLINQKDIDGLFIGRSALDPENFNNIIRKCL